MGSQGRPGRNSTQPGHQHQDLYLKGHGHLDVESLLSSITHLRCVQASQNADNDHGAPGYAGGQLSRLYRDDRPVLARAGVDRQDRAEQPQQEALSPSTSCGLTSNRTWNNGAWPLSQSTFGKNSDKDDTSGSLQSWFT